jgi:NADPH2:quinone reductase
VIATAHTDAERELVSRLGAEVVVDYHADLASQVRAAAPDGVDAVAHLAGDASVVELVREGGRFASTLLQSPERVPAETATVIPVTAGSTCSFSGSSVSGVAEVRSATMSTSFCPDLTHR